MEPQSKRMKKSEDSEDEQNRASLSNQPEDPPVGHRSRRRKRRAMYKKLLGNKKCGLIELNDSDDDIASITSISLSELVPTKPKSLVPIREPRVRPLSSVVPPSSDSEEDDSSNGYQQRTKEKKNGKTKYVQGNNLDSYTKLSGNKKLEAVTGVVMVSDSDNDDEMTIFANHGGTNPVMQKLKIVTRKSISSCTTNLMDSDNNTPSTSRTDPACSCSKHEIRPVETSNLLEPLPLLEQLASNNPENMVCQGMPIIDTAEAKSSRPVSVKNDERGPVNISLASATSTSSGTGSEIENVPTRPENQVKPSQGGSHWNYPASTSTASTSAVDSNNKTTQGITKTRKEADQPTKSNQSDECEDFDEQSLAGVSVALIDELNIRRATAPNESHQFNAFLTLPSFDPSWSSNASTSNRDPSTENKPSTSEPKQAFRFCRPDDPNIPAPKRHAPERGGPSHSSAPFVGTLDDGAHRDTATMRRLLEALMVFLHGYKDRAEPKERLHNRIPKEEYVPRTPMNENVNGGDNPANSQIPKWKPRLPNGLPNIRVTFNAAKPWKPQIPFPLRSTRVPMSTDNNTVPQEQDDSLDDDDSFDDNDDDSFDALVRDDSLDDDDDALVDADDSDDNLHTVASVYSNDSSAQEQETKSDTDENDIAEPTEPTENNEVQFSEQSHNDNPPSLTDASDELQHNIRRFQQASNLALLEALNRNWPNFARSSLQNHNMFEQDELLGRPRTVDDDDNVGPPWVQNPDQPYFFERTETGNNGTDNFEFPSTIYYSIRTPNQLQGHTNVCKLIKVPNFGNLYEIPNRRSFDNTMVTLFGRGPNIFPRPMRTPQYIPPRRYEGFFNGKIIKIISLEELQHEGSDTIPD